MAAQLSQELGMSKNNAEIRKTNTLFGFWGVGLALGIANLFVVPLFQQRYVEIADRKSGMLVKHSVGFAEKVSDNAANTPISFWLLSGLLFGVGIGLYISNLFETDE